MTELLPRGDELRLFWFRCAEVNIKRNNSEVDVDDAADGRSPQLNRHANRDLERSEPQCRLDAQRDTDVGFKIKRFPINDDVEKYGEPRRDAARMESRFHPCAKHSA